MALEKLLLFKLIFLIAVRQIKPLPASCLEDSQCTDGYFCVNQTLSCHECLRCENFRRNSPSTPNACIKSSDQCGPCLQGLINTPRWSGLCASHPTYIWFLVTCVFAGALLSLVIVHIVDTIWNSSVFVYKVKYQIELTA